MGFKPRYSGFRVLAANHSWQRKQRHVLAKGKTMERYKDLVHVENSKNFIVAGAWYTMSQAGKGGRGDTAQGENIPSMLRIRESTLVSPSLTLFFFKILFIYF